MAENAPPRQGGKAPMDTIEEMEKIAKNTVEHYKSDFFTFDMKIIEDMEEGDEAIWEVRKTGTYLFPCRAACHETCDFFRSVHNEFHTDKKHHWYFIMKGKTIEQISDKTALWFIDAFEKTFVRQAKKAYQKAMEEWRENKRSFPTPEEFLLTSTD